MASTRRKRIAGRAFAAALTLAGAGVICAPAYAGLVRIITPSGGGQTLDLSSLPGKPDVPDATYSAIDLTPGGTPEPVTVTAGYSVKALLADAGLKSTPFGSAEIVAPAGPPVVLSYTQATSTFAYADGPPVVWNGGSGAQFLVPSTPTGSTNAGESFAGSGGVVTIQLYSGQPLAVGIYATPQPAIVNKPVTLRASIFGGAVSSYQWSLGDNTTSTTVAPIHTYTRIGTYNVYLSVLGPTAPGASSVIHVVVGSPPPAPIAGSGGPGPGGTGLGGNGTGTGGTGRGAGSPGRATVTPSPPRRRRALTRRARKAPPTTGPLVTGILIADTPQAIAAAERAAAGAARSARTARRDAALAQWVYIVIAVLAMLFVGAVLEWNNPRAWFAPASAS